MTVSGSNFVVTPNNEVRCKFGSAAPVAGSFVTCGAAVCVVCTSPNIATVGFVPLEVALNGVKFTSDGVVFLLYANPMLTSVVSDLGPKRGGMPIQLAALGGGFIASTYTRVAFTWVFANGTAVPGVAPAIAMATVTNSSTVTCTTPAAPT